MEITIIAAVAENGVIGNNNSIPWRIAEDMRRFKALTTAHPVIMGRKTYESFPPKFRPLPERKNIVLSSSFQSTDKIHIAGSIDEALKLAEGMDPFIIGGSRVYGDFLPRATRMELTKVHGLYQGDAFFPEVNWDEWQLLNESRSVTREGVSYSFMTYRRK